MISIVINRSPKIAVYIHMKFWTDIRNSSTFHVPRIAAYPSSGMLH